MQEEYKQAQFQTHAQGGQIFLGAGQEMHLGHELGHVVQQKQGRVQATEAVRGQALTDDRSLEQEAERFG